MVWSGEIGLRAAFGASGSGGAEAFPAREAEVANSRRTELAAGPLDVPGYQPRWEEVSPRMVMIHVLLEYGRRNGHADFLREGIDGSAGACLSRACLAQTRSHERR
ncbi:MAG TPA: DUF664 domain-containing protein [Trebonia sp.]|jgi:hypothetical protein|nr:DUF664 domain-containing protein [Trebonia sp.]